MKPFIKNALVLFICLVSGFTYAQEERNKITMTINHGGKNVTAELTAVNFGISRYEPYPTEVPAATDAKPADKSKTVLAPAGQHYLSLSIKKVSPELLKIFGKKGVKFDGTITLTDTYGKNPTSELKFTKATLESYNDQFSSVSYDDNYSYSAITLKCEGVTINGVAME